MIRPFPAKVRLVRLVDRKIDISLVSILPVGNGSVNLDGRHTEDEIEGVLLSGNKLEGDALLLDIVLHT